MGYNTTVVILNDGLGDIEKDPEFGKKLVDRIRGMYRLPEVDSIDINRYVPAGSHANVAKIIEQHHADDVVLVAVGANTGRVVETEYIGYHDSTDDVILKALAQKHGFRLVRKQKKKKETS